MWGSAKSDTPKKADTVPWTLYHGTGVPRSFLYLLMLWRLGSTWYQQRSNHVEMVVADVLSE
jgi:hypothetical protein